MAEDELTADDIEQEQTYWYVCDYCDEDMSQLDVGKEDVLVFCYRCWTEYNE